MPGSPAPRPDLSARPSGAFRVSRAQRGPCAVAALVAAAMALAGCTSVSDGPKRPGPHHGARDRDGAAEPGGGVVTSGAGARTYPDGGPDGGHGGDDAKNGEGGKRAKDKKKGSEEKEGEKGAKRSASASAPGAAESSAAKPPKGGPGPQRPGPSAPSSPVSPSGGAPSTAAPSSPSPSAPEQPRPTTSAPASASPAPEADETE